jgi:MFS family permease
LTNREKREVQKSLSGFDGLGSVFVLIFFSLVLCVPSFGQNFGWSSIAFMFVLIAAVLSLVILIFAERKAKTPILQGSFMKRRSFVLSIAALFLTQGLMQANMTNIIVFVNYTQPENTVISGYAISIMYIGMSLGSVLLGPLADKFEPKRILSVSFVITGIGCALMLMFSPTTSILLLAASLGFLGFGLGANATIFMRVVLSGISPQKAGVATGTYGLFRDLAAPFGVAVFVPLFTNRVTSNINMGNDEISAAVSSIKLLSITEIICVAAGLAAVVLLPKIHRRNENINEVKE